MASIKKTLSRKVDANGNTQVMLYVVLGRNGRFRVKSGVSVPLQYWNDKKEDVSIPQKIGINIKQELQQIRERLDTTVKRVYKLIDLYADKLTKEHTEHVLTLFKDYDGTLTADVINEALEAEAERTRKENMLSVFDVCEEFLAKGYSDARIRNFRVVFRSMARFELYRNFIANNPFAWNIDEVTRKDIEEFFDYLSKEHLYRKKYAKIYDKHKVIYNEENKAKHKTVRIEARGENTLVGIRRKVSTFWRWLVKTKRTSNFPLEGVEIGVEKYGTPYYLTSEERNIIAEHDFSNNKHLETQRDIFVLHCLIGCRVGDLTKMMPDNIVNGVLVYTPHKTKDEEKSFTARVPLSERALQIINKYQGKDPLGRLMPFIADQNYNEAIKAILTACEITRIVNVRDPKTGETVMKPINEIASSHMARRTFVGNAYKVVKDPNIVGRMSGHVEGSKAFTRYRDIDDDILKEVINAIQ